MSTKQDVKTLDDSIPAYLQEYQGKTGLEDIGQDDIATPRLQLLQALSPQLEEDDSLKPGMFYHSGAEEGLPAEITVIPLAIAKSYTLWRPRPASGILARSRDGINWDRTGSWPDIILKGGKRVTWSIKTLNVRQSKMAEWGSSDPDNADSNPAAVLAINIPVLIPSRIDLGPAVLSMQRSQIKVARKLLGRLKLLKFPLWAIEMPMCSCKDQGPEGPFFNIAFGRKFGLIQDENLAATARNLFDMFQEKGVVVAEDEQAPDDTHHAPSNGSKSDLDDEISF
jgi:hypothetical protein